MATEREVPMVACRSTASVAASLIPPPNQNDSFVVAAGDDQFASCCGQDFFSASVSCNSRCYSAPEKSTDAGSSLLSSVFQAEQSSFDLYIPQCEDEAELEWLSRFMEESSFSDVEPAPPPAPSCAAEKPDAGHGVRSKRPRRAPWTALAMNSPSSSSSSSEFSSDGAGRTKKGRVASPRRCTHCASESTPQWRTGPLGPRAACAGVPASGEPHLRPHAALQLPPQGHGAPAPEGAPPQPPPPAEQPGPFLRPTDRDPVRRRCRRRRRRRRHLNPVSSIKKTLY